MLAWTRTHSYPFKKSFGLESNPILYALILSFIASFDIYLKKILKYKLEKNSFCCEVCGTKKELPRKAAKISVNEFHKNGTIKLHYTGSNHIVDIYNKIVRNNE